MANTKEYRTGIHTWFLSSIAAVIMVVFYTWVAGLLYMKAVWSLDPGHAHQPYWSNAVATLVFSLLVGLGTLRFWKFGICVTATLGTLSLVALVQGHPSNVGTFWSYLKIGTFEMATWGIVPLLLILSIYAGYQQQRQ